MQLHDIPKEVVISPELRKIMVSLLARFHSPRDNLTEFWYHTLYKTLYMRWKYEQIWETVHRGEAYAATNYWTRYYDPDYESILDSLTITVSDKDPYNSLG